MPTDPAIASAIRRTDYLRRGLVRGRRKEWLHFCVLAGDVEILINLSLSDLSPTAEFGRVVMLARTGGGEWVGGIDTVAHADIDARAGGMDLELGASAARWYDDAFHVHARLESGAVSATLRLRPVVQPAFIPNFPLVPGMPVHWLLVPRLVADGEVTVGSRTVRLADAHGYHDHNWGEFQWGADFAWEWGYALPDDRDNPWSLVFVRFTDRGRTHARLQSLMLWRGSERVALIRDGALTVARHGLFGATVIPKFPPIMRLLSPGTATDVPAALSVRARPDDGALDLTYTPSSIAQLVAPNDLDLRLTHINETSGPVQLRGTLAGEKIELVGRGMWEFLHG